MPTTLGSKAPVREELERVASLPVRHLRQDLYRPHDPRRLKDEYTASVLPLKALAQEADIMERQVLDLVNAAFGLTPAGVALMWETALPPMPIGPPGSDSRTAVYTI